MVNYVAGVDEAGRGPVIGPMVMAIAAIPLSKEKELKAIGVKDSKLLAPTQREVLYKKLKRLVKYKVRVLTPHEIDAAVCSQDMNLNWLEAITSVALIDALAKELTIKQVILDCPSTNINAYNSYVTSRLTKKVLVKSEHKADVNYLIVSAASIIAKVLRDREIKKLREAIGEDFGSGYPSDPKTIAFVKRHYATHATIFRKTWSTYKNAIGSTYKKQTRLGDF